MVRKFIKKALGGDPNDGEPDAVEDYRDYRHGVEYDRINEYPYNHYTQVWDDVKQLKRERRHDEVEALLLWCIEFIETETEHQDQWPQGPMAISPGYFEHLGIVYRKDGRHNDEVAVLERYMDLVDKYGHGPHDKMPPRLERARELANDT